MKFDVFRQSSGEDNATIQPIEEVKLDADNRWVLEVNSVEELVALAARVKCGVAIYDRASADAGDLDVLEILDAEGE